MMREAGKESDIDKLTGRRDDISLQGMATTAAAAKEAGEEEEDMKMRAVLSQLSDITVFTFNLAFLTVMEAAAAS
ncbi:uncharacterized protein BDCG_04679 [Blastomyces dermatitidis ER-3]|uniref:Uncharacterized protein n=1 Tax=Ajellomyces dermatitidis (strain ER-3 / ATCC MYA-2586) TaxID=559297 RepID=A0ABM9YHN3_AJEDR|nr:uncharacterized protein BDCG_04679 [Blastomyces dermatitidis ER-3]EEQ89559.2 hypothetical protein BDCG_04679 [Blastomyces dermatitidis ER-3]